MLLVGWLFLGSSIRLAAVLLSLGVRLVEELFPVVGDATVVVLVARHDAF